MKKFDMSKINQKEITILAAVVLIAVLGISEPFNFHADTVAVKHVRVFDWLTNSCVFKFENGNPCYEIVGQRMAEYESGM